MPAKHMPSTDNPTTSSFADHFRDLNISTFIDPATTGLIKEYAKQRESIPTY
jgi:hypothetical protein